MHRLPDWDLTPPPRVFQKAGSGVQVQIETGTSAIPRQRTNTAAPESIHLKWTMGKMRYRNNILRGHLAQLPMEKGHMVQQRRCTYMENLTVIIANMKVSEKVYKALKMVNMVVGGRISICFPKPR